MKKPLGEGICTPWHWLSCRQCHSPPPCQHAAAAARLHAVQVEDGDEVGRDGLHERRHAVICRRQPQPQPCRMPLAAHLFHPLSQPRVVLYLRFFRTAPQACSSNYILPPQACSSYVTDAFSYQKGLCRPARPDFLHEPT